MRELHKHKVNTLNREISLFVLDEPNENGACNLYSVQSKGVEIAKLSFQTDKKIVNGITNEILLAILLDRVKGFQKGPLKCEENGYIISHIKGALVWVHKRMKRRLSENRK